MPPKPFLRKGGGVSGRLMQKINYPGQKAKNFVENQRKSSSGEQQSTSSDSNGNQSSSCGKQQRSGSSRTSSSVSNRDVASPEGRMEEMHDIHRPYTAGTADSGCPEDSNSVVLSPVSARKDDAIESVVMDVTDRSNVNSVVSYEMQNNRDGIHSVVPDLSSSSADDPEIVSAVSSRSNYLTQKAPANTSVGDSTAEYERIESHINALVSPGPSETSQGTDGTRSRHWRQVIKEFSKEVKNKPIVPLESVSASGVSSAASSNRTPEEISHNVIPTNVIKNSKKESSKKLRSMRETFPSIFTEKAESDNYAHVKKVTNKEGQKDTVLVEKSLEDITAEKPQKKVSQSATEQRNLAKQLRDLIAHIDVAAEHRRHEYERFEKIFDEALQEKEYFHQQVNEMRKRIVQLEEDEQARKENQALLQETDKLRSADLERLRRENAILSRKQLQKNDSDTEVVTLLKQQVNNVHMFSSDFLSTL